MSDELWVMSDEWWKLSDEKCLPKEALTLSHSLCLHFSFSVQFQAILHVLVKWYIYSDRWVLSQKVNEWMAEIFFIKKIYLNEWLVLL